MENIGSAIAGTASLHGIPIPVDNMSVEDLQGSFFPRSAFGVNDRTENT